MRGKIGASFVATCVFLLGGAAQADILFIDTNDQAIERKAIEELGRKYGERVHIVPADGPELEEVFRKADAGEIKLTTVVGSGHSSGTTFAGKNGSMSGIDGVLAKFPGAKNQIRHFIGLGCYTGTKYASAEWQGRFPNATVLAGFNGIAPSGMWSARFLTQVFTAIMSARQRAGDTDDAFATKLGSDATALATLKSVLTGLESVKITVASFQMCEQFFDPKGRTREKIKSEVYAGLNVMRGYLNGWGGREDVPPDPHAPSPLRTFYNDVQAYLGDATIDERDELVKAKEQTIRLIYFANVKTNVVRSLTDSEIAAANVALALQPPRWGGDGKPLAFPTKEALAKMKRGEITNLISQIGYNLPTVVEPAPVVTPSTDSTDSTDSTATPVVTPGPTAGSHRGKAFCRRGSGKPSASPCRGGMN